MSSLISTIIVVAGLVGVYYVIKGQPIPFLDDFFKSLGLGGLGGGAKPATTPSAPSGGGATGPVNTSAGEAGLIMKGTGKTWKAVDSGKTTRNYASGGSSGTTQWDIKGVGPIKNLEVTVFVNVGSCGDEVSLKVFGPNHSDNNCCWLIMNVDCNSGLFQLGGEGPHPKTSKTNLGTGQSIGSLKNKEVGIKLVVYAQGSNYTAIGYAYQGGWKEMLRKTFTQWGDAKKTGTPHGSATVQFRTDCNGVKYRNPTASEILPPGGSAATSAYGNLIWSDDDGRHYESMGDHYVSYYATPEETQESPQNIFAKILKAVDDITPQCYDDSPQFLPISY